MHNPIRFHRSDADIIDRNVDLQKRQFMKTLFKVGTEKCVEFLADSVAEKSALNACRNEIMVAASCVLLNKTNNNAGDLKDNVHLCKHEIKLSEKYLNEKFHNFPNDNYEKWLQSLSFSTKSFC